MLKERRMYRDYAEEGFCKKSNICRGEIFVTTSLADHRARVRAGRNR